MDYVPLIHKLLTDKVDSIVQSYVRRKEYTAALLSMMGRSVLEYDTEGFKKVAFLFEQQGFSFVAHCKLTAQAIAPIGSISLHKVSPSLPPSLSLPPPPPPPPAFLSPFLLPLSLPSPFTPSLSLVELTDDFPKEQPSVVLRSVYHSLEGFPCQSVVSDYPYSPRWSAEEKAERIRYCAWQYEIPHILSWMAGHCNDMYHVTTPDF